MKHNNSYLICATPRSGSTLLCDLLTGTNVAGRPESFFMRRFYTDWASYLNVSVADWNGDHEFDRSYLEAVLAEGAGETPVFGMRLQWESLADLSKRLQDFYPDAQTDRDLFRSAFGTSLFIHLSRQDKIAQAVSLMRAEQTGLWHVNSDGTERERLEQGHAPVYDSEALSALVGMLEDHDASWRNWFARQEIQPISITYERLSADPQIVLASLLSALGLDSSIAKTVEPKTARLASSESQEWVERYRAEQSDQAP